MESWYTSWHSGSSILNQLQFPNSTQRQPHVELITITELGGDQRMTNYSKVFLCGARLTTMSLPSQNLLFTKEKVISGVGEEINIKSCI